MTLLILVVCGLVAAIIAAGKGRNPIGWFFGGFLLGLVGIVIVAVLSNLKEEEARRKHAAKERRRLREQLRQERLKTEAFRQHAAGRLDTHDEMLGVDTRPAPALGSGEEQGRLRGPPPIPSGSEADGEWFFEDGGEAQGPVTGQAIRRLVEEGRIVRETLVWKRGMEDWAPARRLKGLHWDA